MDRAVRGIQTASPMLSRPVNISDVTFSFLGFVFGKISEKSCRAGLDTVVALDLREGHASGSWAPRKHEPSPRRRGLGPSGRDAAESGDGGLPPPSRTESAVRVGALSRRCLAGGRKFGENVEWICGTQVTADSVQQQPIAAPEGSEINHGIHRNTRKRESESTSPFRVLPGGGPTPAGWGAPPVGWGRSVVTRL